MTFLHTLLEDEELSGVQRELVCRHLQGTQQLQAQLQGDDISVAAAAAMADVPMADSAAATALPMPARRAMRASSFPLVTMRNTFSDKRQEPGRRARTDSLTADERIGVLRKGLRTMFREHPKTPLTSEQQTEQQPNQRQPFCSRFNFVHFVRHFVLDSLLYFHRELLIFSKFDEFVMQICP